MEADPYLLTNSFVFTFVLTAVLVLILCPVAERIGLVDAPDARKAHSGNIPLVGGIAIFAGYGLSCALLGGSMPLPDYFFVASAILVIAGVLDDFVELSARSRFLAQILAALVMVFGGRVVLEDLGALSWDGSLFTLGVFMVPMTIFSTVGVVNAINMSDGVDGLAGSYVLIAVIGLAIVSFVAGQDAQGSALVLFAAGLLAFLVFNYRMPGRARATVFLGDAGSMFLGFALTWFIVSSCQGENRIMTPVTALWFLALPLFDTVGIMLRRVLKGRSPFAADREHFHHVLLLANFSVNQSLLIMAMLAMAGVVIGLAGLYLRVPEMWSFIAFLALFALYFFGMMHAWKVMRFLRRSICRRRNAGDRRSAERRRVAEWQWRQRFAAAAMNPSADRVLVERRCGQRRLLLDRRGRGASARRLSVA